MGDLQITVSHLPEPDGKALSMALPIEQLAAMLDGAPELTAASPLSIDLSVVQLIGSVQVLGSVQCDLEGVCGRCLEAAPVHIDVNVTTTFMPRTSAPVSTDGEEIDLDEDDLDLCFYNDDTIDLAEFVREVVILELPAYPLCKEDCAGLCSVCGVNLNATTCDCDRFVIDPRLAPLMALKKRLEEP